MNLDQRRKQVLQNIGADAITILKQTGLDVDSAVTNILQLQEQRRKALESEADSRNLRDIMTSELIFRTASIEGLYGQEFTRRLKAIGLSEEQIRALYQQEKYILSRTKELEAHRQRSWVRRYFIFNNSTQRDMPKGEELTLSELILITDDVNSAFFRDHHQLSEDAWKCVIMASCCAKYSKAEYYKAFQERTERLGWRKEQGNAYAKNENLLLARLKWDMTADQAWTRKTCDLSKYRK